VCAIVPASGLVTIAAKRLAFQDAGIVKVVVTARTACVSAPATGKEPPVPNVAARMTALHPRVQVHVVVPRRTTPASVRLPRLELTVLFQNTQHVNR